MIEVKKEGVLLTKTNLDFESEGVLNPVNNVCFPTGTFLSDDTLYIYYGAADEQMACASVSISALLIELINNKKNNEK